MMEACAHEKAKRQGGHVWTYRPLNRSKWHPCTNLWRPTDKWTREDEDNPGWFWKSLVQPPHTTCHAGKLDRVGFVQYFAAIAWVPLPLRKYWPMTGSFASGRWEGGSLCP